MKPLTTFVFSLFIFLTSFASPAEATPPAKIKSSLWKPQGIGGNEKIHRCFIKENRAMVVYTSWKPQRTVILYFLDISQPQSPKLLARHEHSDRLSNMSDVKLDWTDTHLYMATSGPYNCYLVVLDISNLRAIKVVNFGRLKRSPTYYIEFPRQVWAEKKRLYVEVVGIASGDKSTGNLFVFDISTPQLAAKPKLLGQGSGRIIGALDTNLLMAKKTSTFLAKIDTNKSPIFAEEFDLGGSYSIRPKKGIRLISRHNREVLVKINTRNYKDKLVSKYVILNTNKLLQQKFKELNVAPKGKYTGFNKDFLFSRDKMGVYVYLRNLKNVNEQAFFPSKLAKRAKISPMYSKGKYLYAIQGPQSLAIVGPLPDAPKKAVKKKPVKK